MIPAEPTREMLMALAGNPLLLAASDEAYWREAYARLRAVMPDDLLQAIKDAVSGDVCPGSTLTVESCNALKECGCVWGRLYA